MKKSFKVQVLDLSVIHKSMLFQKEKKNLCNLNFHKIQVIAPLLKGFQLELT